MWSTIKMFTVCIGLGVPAWLIGMPITFLTGTVDRMYRWGTGAAHAGVIASGIRLEISGVENIPSGQACIFMSNHLSNLDPPILIPTIPGRVAVMVKKSLMRIPLLGVAMKMGKFVWIERENRRGALQAMRAGAEAIHSGLNMLIFVEGTRSKTGRLLPFKKGPFYLAQHTGELVVPIVLVGTQTMLRKGSWAIRPGVARIRYLQAVDPKQFPQRDELMDEVRRRMIEALPEEMRPLPESAT